MGKHSLRHYTGRLIVPLPLRIVLMSLARLVLLSLSLLPIAGCGQKGDLYRPDAARPAEQPATPPAATPAVPDPLATE
jgi:predicted small lipoprotein YifL